MKHLPMDLLRTFVTIRDQGGFTQAGNLLGRSQPAVSLQIKRLEALLNRPLLNRINGLSLTDEGRLLYEYACKILDLNDTAIAKLSKPYLRGLIKIGIPNDFEASFLPTLFSQFSQLHPNVTLDIRSDVSIVLNQAYNKGVYDVVMFMSEASSHPFAEGDYVMDSLVWVTRNGFTLPKDQPIPLVAHPKGCLYRHHMTQALDQANIAWRILYSSSNVSGIESAIEAGLGIGCMAQHRVPKHLSAQTALLHLPALGQVAIGLNYDQEQLSPAAHGVLEAMRAGLKQTDMPLLAPYESTL